MIEAAETKETEIRAALDTEGVRFLTPIEGECFAFYAKGTVIQIVILGVKFGSIPMDLDSPLNYNVWC